MRVTYNELIALSTKCFNSLNLPIGEVDRVAHMVADLELVGYPGLEYFLQSLQSISHDPTDFAVSQVDEITIDVDLKGGSVVLHLPTIMYYARQKLLNQQNIIVNIHNAYNRWLAYGELKKLSERGYCVNATWGRREVEQTIYYVLNKNAKHPDLYLINEKPKNDVLQIHIAKEAFDAPKPTIHTRHVSSYNLAIEREKSVRNGVEVSDSIWKSLTDIAKTALVQNSEQSEQRGAGGV